jgi:FlaA1/EpsC-like NDP-sugar epimerase
LLAILFLFVGLAQLLGLPLMLGAFWGGVSVSGFPIRGFIRGTLHSLSNFFVVAFFTTLGAILGWPDLSELLLTALLVCLVYLITPPLVTFLAERAGMSGRAALESGLLLSQTSEFSIILAVVGLQQGHISGSILEVMTLVTVITMVLTPMVATDKMAWRLLRLHPSRWQRKPVAAPSGHILLLGCGESGRLIADSLLQAGKPVVVIDDDPAVVQQLRSAGMNAIRGDGADYRVLDAAGARQARVIVSTMRRFRDHTAVLKYAKGAKVICRVFEERDANRLRHRGAIVVLYSIPAAEDFLRWFDRQYHCEPPA